MKAGMEEGKTTTEKQGARGGGRLCQLFSTISNEHKVQISCKKSADKDKSEVPHRPRTAHGHMKTHCSSCDLDPTPTQPFVFWYATNMLRAPVHSQKKELKLRSNLFKPFVTRHVDAIMNITHPATKDSDYFLIDSITGMPPEERAHQEGVFRLDDNNTFF